MMNDDQPARPDNVWCRFCGVAFRPERAHQQFCKPAHTTAFHSKEKRQAMRLLRLVLDAGLDPATVTAPAIGKIPGEASLPILTSATRNDVVELLSRLAGYTSAELADLGDFKRHSVSSRLAELTPQHAHKGARRKCVTTGNQAATWYGGPKPRDLVDEANEGALLALIDRCDAALLTRQGVQPFDAWTRQRKRLINQLGKIPR